MTFSIAMRNITATLVIAINYMPPDAALPAVFGILLQQAIGSIIVSIAFKGRS